MASSPPGRWCKSNGSRYTSPQNRLYPPPDVSGTVYGQLITTKQAPPALRNGQRRRTFPAWFPVICYHIGHSSRAAGLKKGAKMKKKIIKRRMSRLWDATVVYNYDWVDGDTYLARVSRSNPAVGIPPACPLLTRPARLPQQGPDFSTLPFPPGGRSSGAADPAQIIPQPTAGASVQALPPELPPGESRCRAHYRSRQKKRPTQ